MSKCFVTKLKGVVDVDLLKVGELRINITKKDSNTPNKFLFRADEAIEIKLIGDGYFTNENGSENKGKTASIQTVNTNIYVSNDNCQISIPNKYVLFNVSLLSSNCEFDLSGIKYSSQIQQISAEYTSSEGDISNIPKNVLNLYLSGTKTFGDLSALSDLSVIKVISMNDNDNIVGDISSIKALTSLNILQLSKTHTYGDISNLKDLTKLTTFILQETTGNVETLSGLSSLTSFTCNNSTLTGDLSKLPSSCTLVNFPLGSSKFNWTTRQSGAKILTIQGASTVIDLDTMLIDQASRDAPSINIKIISVKGTRTSASDSAIATLQSKGYTVSIISA